VRDGRRLYGAALAVAGVLVAVAAPAARALPPPDAPRIIKSAAPTAAPSGATLPFGSTLYFVLDDKVSSGTSKPGAVIRMHLKDALIVNGITLAPAGSAAELVVVMTQPSAVGNIDGAVQIHLDPFELPGRNLMLPIRAYHEYVTMERTAGQLSTRDATDTIGDILIPYHVLYHYLRPGQQLVLPPGSIVPARTAATIDAGNPRAIVLSTPPPFESTYDPPHADLTAPPLYTPGPMRPHPLAHGRPTLPPKPAPNASDAGVSPAPAAPGAVPSAPPAATAPPAAAATGVQAQTPAQPSTPQP
jgi:hypothetical protein